MSTVKIVADELGNVIRQSSKNPEFGYIRLTQSRSMIGSNNFVNVKNLSTLIHGKLEDLEKTGLQYTKEINGKIYVIEQLTPFTEENGDRDYKYAGDTGIICATSDGEPIYRKTFYSEDENVSDTLIAHANGDAIREANGTSAKIMKEVQTKQMNLEESIAEVEENESVTEEVTPEEKTEVEDTPVLEEITEDEGVESFDL